jgi:ferredoxin-NADP reductase
LLSQTVPDYAERTFYISGSSPMVDAAKEHLGQLGVKNPQIKTDHFTGY